jgi:L-threonylcarbamoyladenylate synthase
VSLAVLRDEHARELEECLASGGVAVFPTDTVYGLCCDPEDGAAVRRLYELKGRPAERPAAVMFFALAFLLRTLPEIRNEERAALEALLPGPATILLPNRAHRFPLTGGSEVGDVGSLGLRVPELPPALSALSTVGMPVLQSSANLSGEPDARCLRDVPQSILAGADLTLDGGELPGIPSTVIDLCDYGSSRQWRVVREGGLSSIAVAALLTSMS